MIHRHLTPEEIALCADQINIGKYSLIPSDLRNHLATCDICVSELLTVSELSHNIKLAEPIQLQKPAPRTNRIKYFAAAAALLILTILVLKLRDYTPNENQSQHQQIAKIKSEVTGLENRAHGATASNTPKQNEKRSQQMLAHYEPNEKLEMLMESYQYPSRSESAKSIYKEGLTNATLIADSLCWPQQKETNYTVEILNNKNKLLYSINTDADCITLPDLAPGLYYWKIINQDYDLLYIGKVQK